MLANEKTTFTKLLKSNYTFLNIIKKIDFHETLSEDEKTYILSIAITFLKFYLKDKKNISYADFAYYIILHYTIITSDLEPIYDFSTNFGFYPITNEILKINQDNNTLFDGMIMNSLNHFLNEKGGYIETLEQSILSKSILQDESYEKGYIAPTSFGKSSLISEIVRSFNGNIEKIAIIVPTKSLLVQTYKNIIKDDLNKKIILHDGMYNNEDEFIAILTQERALKMIDTHGVSFDALMIDEAHNIFDGDYRSLLLSRLIKKNYNLNNAQFVYYFSPLIKDIENVKINHHVNAYNIKFNIKEPVLYEYKESTREIFQFNRFLGKFRNTGNQAQSWLQYVSSSIGEKKFIYESTPRKIESVANDICQSITIIDNLPQTILNLKEILTQQVHEKFYILDTIDYGVLYLHGKMPDLIKEYLESKFKEIKELKYLVANNVILEGINLPIDSLFIAGYFKLDEKKIMNLIGRVNRLNYIFGNDQGYDFNSLTPKIYFLNTGDNHLPKLEKLRGRIFDDKIKNPLLDSYDLENEIRKTKLEDRQKLIDKVSKIRSDEYTLVREITTIQERIKKDLIQLGISIYYNNIQLLSEHIESLLEPDLQEISIEDLLNIIHSVFFNNIDNINDNELKRLNYEEARIYYTNYILISSKKSLKNNIEDQFRYLVDKSVGVNPLLYIGSGFGEITYKEGTLGYPEPYKKVYINLSGKSEKYLINIAIAKIKIEEDFISYTLTKFVEFLYKYRFINSSIYNKFIYGTDDEFQLRLTKTGLSISLITRLLRVNQLQNLYYDLNNNLCANREFKIFLETIDDFYKFEIERHLIA